MGDVILEGVGKSFAGGIACADVNLSIAKGEFFTLLGPSGCGKTTILRLIAGFLTPQSGAIHLDGRDVTNLPPEKRKVGMVFQNYALFPYLNVRRNIEYGLKIQRRSPGEIRASADKYMEMVGLSGFGDRMISELSGGEQQRTALARSLAVEPGVLLLDEPLSNLDARLRDKMRMEIKSLQRALGVTTVFVTHDQTEALTLSDRIAVFNKGRLVQAGPPEELYARPQNSFVAGFLGDTNLLEVDGTDGEAFLAGGLKIHASRPAGRGRRLSIRPQDITLSQKPRDVRNCFEGRLEDTQLNGVWVDCTARVRETALRAAALNTTGNGLGARRGEAVFVSFSEESVIVLER